MNWQGTTAQPISVLRTKCHTPQVRSDWVRRPRLEERLDQGLARKLVLISAPAGFGKSSLVASVLAESKRQAAWLSLDEGDNDPVRFWTYVIAAIQAVEQEAGKEAGHILTSPQLRRTDPVIISLLNEISELSYDLILVLDDYHVIEAEQIHEDLGYLFDRQPANLHIVLTSRADPPISLARLRAHGQLVEIRAVDLQFSSDEAVTLLNDVGKLQLKPEQVAALHLRTEGWIVGLQLASLFLRGHPATDTFFKHFTGSHQFVLDYLTEEVLRALPDAQRRFLLRTSILDRFCSALCDAVMGDAASQQLLDEIRKGNLFLVPLEPSGRWFRYHHLFADVLQAWLRREAPDKVAALHLKAAAWFEDQGYAGEAVDYALRSGDKQRAKELILNHWNSTLRRGEVATVLRWLNALPAEMERDDPFLALARCWGLLLSGQSMAITPHLERVNAAYQRRVREGTLDGAQQNLVAAQLEMMRSVLARGLGRHAESVSHAGEAVRLVPPAMLETAGTAWNMLGVARAGVGDFDRAIEAYDRGIELARGVGNLVGAYACTYGWAMYMLSQGRLKEAAATCRSAIARAAQEGHGDLPAAGWLHIAMARIELQHYCLDEAQAYADDGLWISHPGGFGELLLAGRYVRAHLAAARGDQEGAVGILQDTERIVDAMDDPYLSGELAEEWTMVCLKAGDLHGARIKLAELAEMCAVTRHANLRLARDWLTVRLLCAEERYSEALAELTGAIDGARASDGTGALVRLLALQAVALEATGKREAARSVLQEGVMLGAPGGYIRRWLDAGPAIAPLLRDARDEGNTPRVWHSYLDSLLDACGRAFGESALQPERPLAGEMLDPLTPRELEIVGLICEGYSGPEIATELVLAYNTVRKHISNIYSKLGVRSRAQAIARVRELNFL